MDLSPTTINLIKKSNNLSELRLFIREYLKIRYQWVNNISDIQALKEIILNNLFNVINKSLTENISHKSQLKGLSIKNIKLFVQNKIYTVEQGEKYILLLSENTKQRKKSRSNKRNVKKSMGSPKKEKKKAVSSWYLQLFAIIIFVRQL